MEFEGIVLLNKRSRLKNANNSKSPLASLVPLSLLSNKLLQSSSIIGKLNLSELVNLTSDSVALIISTNRELNMKKC